jgi:hypothetical protein
MSADYVEIFQTVVAIAECTLGAGWELEILYVCSEDSC